MSKLIVNCSSICAIILSYSSDAARFYEARQQYMNSGESRFLPTNNE